MSFSSTAFADFYKTRIGVLAERFISLRMRSIWSDVRHHSVLSIGYPQPYLKQYRGQSERTVILTPPSSDAEPFMGGEEEEKNILCVGKPTLQPFPYESFDRVFIIHALEFTENLGEALHECWRVLKPNGRMMIVVPNRMSIWARTDSCPFAYGTPFSFTQIKAALIESNFHIEQHRKALFVPPFETNLMLSLSPFFERMGRSLFKSFGGIHIIEVSKRVYAPIKPDKGGALEAATRILIPAGARSTTSPTNFDASQKGRQD